MTEQTNSHLIERLAFIKIKPEYILCEGISEDDLKKMYPDAKFTHDQKADLIMANIDFSEEIFLKFKKSLKSNGLLLFVLKEQKDHDIDIQALGAFLLGLGFKDVVMDLEDGLVFGHALGPQEISVPLSQIRRAT